MADFFAGFFQTQGVGLYRIESYRIGTGEGARIVVVSRSLPSITKGYFMRSIGRLFGAFGTLAESILSLSAVVDVATGRLRQALAFDEVPTVLDHQPAGGENVPLDGSSNGTAKRGKARAGV